MIFIIILIIIFIIWSCLRVASIADNKIDKKIDNDDN